MTELVVNEILDIMVPAEDYTEHLSPQVLGFEIVLVERLWLLVRHITQSGSRVREEIDRGVATVRTPEDFLPQPRALPPGALLRRCQRRSYRRRYGRSRRSSGRRTTEHAFSAGRD